MSGDQELYASLPQRELEVDGHRIHFVDAGEGPAVLMVHGSPLYSFCFREQISLLSSRFRVIVPDLPGFGLSSAPQPTAGFVTQARVLRGFIDALDAQRELGPLRLVLHDWGGPIGMACAIEKPEQVSQLVLVNTSIHPGFKAPAYWWPFALPGIGELLFVRLNMFAHGLGLLLKAARSPALHKVYAEPFNRVETRRAVLELERLDGFRQLMEKVTGSLARLDAAVLLLWGFPDAYFRTHELDRMLELFPAARLQTLDGGGHFPQEDAADAFSAALLEFLN